MKTPVRLFRHSSKVLLLLALIHGGSDASAAPRERLLLDAGWRFQLGDPADVGTNVPYYPEISDLTKLKPADTYGAGSETNLMALRADPVATHLGESVSFVQTNFNDTAWRALDLPHDWAVELPFNSGADKGHGYKDFTNATKGWYRRTFTLPSSYANKTLSLEFDGVYRNCIVWLNGHCLGRNASGYGSFALDVSRAANCGGTNVLVVRVDASRFEGWFYEGAGIYRHVWLVKTDPLHVAHWGTFVTNAVTGVNAVAGWQTQVNNDGTNAATVNLISSLLDPGGNSIFTATQAVTIAPGTNQVLTQTATVTNARLWSLDFPNLYKLVSTVTQPGVTNDAYETPFGIRTVTWSTTQGLFLNGQHVWIQGMCNHQDHAGVGVALPDRIQEFRVETMKEMGCNVFRMSHNWPAPELLDACDRLGVLVLDENRRVGMDPESLGQLQRGLLRDRNHPSIFAWSLGNEEKYIQGSSTGATVVAVMQNLAHQLDPTRKCTIAMNGSWGSGFSTVIDVQGFNYQSQGNMDSFHTSFPNQPVMGTEEGSAYYARGIYTNTSTYKSAYDVNKPSYGLTAGQWWQFYTARPWASGACYWTGFDYRGEPSPFSWPNISSHFGTIDTCGFPKDTFYYYQANWTLKPVLHLFPHWNWAGREGQPINVWCFSSCDAVELFLNGASQGRQTVNVAGHVEWNVPYAAGTLQAVGYHHGQPVLTNSVSTTGAPARVALQTDRSTLLADGRDVALITVSIVDSNGAVVPTASNSVSFTISGGAILGVGNGDPISHEADKVLNGSWQRSVFNGLAQVIVQSGNQAGPITLTGTSTGLTSAMIPLNAVTNPPAPPAPTGLFTLPDDSRVVVSWDLAPGATGYTVKRATTGGGPYTILATGLAAVGFVDTTVVNGETYYYVVSATNANGESLDSVEVTATPTGLPFVTSQPNSFTSSVAMYAGVPVTFSVAAGGTLPLSYQWFRISGGVTNLIVDATNATLSHPADVADATATGFFVVVSNSSGSVTSSVATLDLGSVVPGTPGTVSVQFTITNYSGYTGGFFLAPGDVAGAFAVSNWNVFVITPAGGAGGTQPGVNLNNLADEAGILSAISLRVVNASDGWHQTQTITAGDTANARMMNTFWKANPNKSSPSTNVLYLCFTNLPAVAYDAYVYLMQNTGSPTGAVYSASGVTNFFREFTKFTSASNFVTAADLTGAVDPAVNYLKLTRIPTGSSNALTIAAAWTSGADGIGVCGVQLIPPPVLRVWTGTNGQFGFDFEAQTNQSYVIETSTNLANWTAALTSMPANAVLQFVNTNATDPQRFYRVR